MFPVLHPGGWPDGNFATPVRSECLFIVTSPLVDFCTRELYRLLAGLKIDSALEILPSVRASHAEMTVIHCYGFINFSLN